jgi:hypothetical protein
MIEMSSDARAEMERVVKESSGKGGKAVRVYVAGHG